tara:strand:- start:524 stop:631 length:108 start_codon:yes stop_codon:yes gene_type:complete
MNKKALTDTDFLELIKIAALIVICYIIFKALLPLT